MNASSQRALNLTTGGCEISGAPPVRFRWREVGAASALLRPGPDDDVVVLRLRLQTGETVEIGEDTAGFTQLVELLPEVLAGFPDRNEWFYDLGEADPSDEVLLYEAPDATPADLGR